MHKIEWNTDLYRRLRNNFHTCDDCQLFGYYNMFHLQIETHGGKIVDRSIYGRSSDIDSLGMNEYKSIEFSDEYQFLLFVLKWG